MAGEKKRDIIEGIPAKFKPSQKRTNHLLGIGIDEYVNVSKLNNAVRDVEAFAQLMEKEYSFQKDNIHLLKNEYASRKNIIKVLKGITQTLTERDNLIFYFSGHGKKDVITEEGFWIPFEGEKEEEDSWLANETIMRYIRSMKAHHIFLLIDACFAGSFFVKARSDASKYDQAPSRFAITSGAEEIVSDGPEGQHSPFASSMLNFLKSHQQSVVGAGGLFEEIKKHIPAGQKPQARHLSINGKLYEGEFCFYRKEDASAKEERAFKQADKIGTEQAWLDFIEACERKEYPAKYLEAAEEKLKLAGEKRIWDGVKRNPTLYNLRSFIRFNSTNPYVPEAQKMYNELRTSREYEVPAPAKQEKSEPVPPKVNPTPPKADEHPFLKSIGQEMVKLEGGSFMMGGEMYGTEKPIHKVTLKDFYIGKYPVTQAQWEKVMGENPSRFKGDLQRPVERVSWEDCQQFIKKLNQQTGMKFRLPSEAEWEYAAKGGKLSKGFTYAGSNRLDEVGWYNENSKNITHPTGQKKPNELGIYDMSGNVLEWCEDDWHDDYKKAPDNGSAWIDQPRGKYRVVRGSSWHHSDFRCRVAIRSDALPSYRSLIIGFRLSGYSAR
ncbi:MAG: SUMF1/EgtB/PvdO family nonheme iron enzyme [Bacteroidota bacterium]